MAPESGIQSLVVKVPAAEPAVSRLRSAGDRWALRGMPAHITVAGHWPVHLELPTGVLSQLSARVAGTPLVLDRVDALGDTICLLPADDAMLLALRQAILNAVGVPDAKDAGWRPHLTVCRGSSASRLREVRTELATCLPIRSVLDGLAIVRAPHAGRVTFTQL